MQCPEDPGTDAGDCTQNPEQQSAGRGGWSERTLLCASYWGSVTGIIKFDPAIRRLRFAGIM
jgi:hypothetical protein